LPVAIMAQLLGPALAGLAMIAICDGRVGFRQLGVRLRAWKAGAGWYFMALLLAPIVIGAILMSLGAIAPVYLPGILTRDDKLAGLMMGISSGIIVGICEELGWTGFVTPRMRQRYSVVATGLIIGFLWGVWHVLPMAIMPGIAYAGDVTPAMSMGMRTLSFLIGSLVSFRILMVWMYDRTESLLLAMVMHFSLTASNIIYEPEGIAGTSLFTLDFVSIAVWWIVVAIAAAASRGQLAAPPRIAASSAAAG
jgi:membrane protease YdiL (CAAX protease family)